MAKVCDFIININGKPTELTREELINHLSKVDKKTGESPFDAFVKEGAKVIDLSSIEQGRLSGVSARALNKVADRLGLEKIPEGEVLSPQEYAKRGKLLIKNGVDPEQVALEYKKNGTVSADTMAVVRAHTDELMKVADDARKKFGLNSNEYKEAASEWNDWVKNTAKPMGTEFGRIGRAMQGETNIDTGSFLSMAAAYEKATGKVPDKAAAAEIEKLTKQVNDTNATIEDLQAKFTEVVEKLAKAEEDAEQSKEGIKEKAKKVAALIRTAKLSKPDMFSAASPASLVWDGAIEVAAKTVEISGDVAQAIKDGIENIKESDWYKNLDSQKKKAAEQEFKDFIKNNTSDRAQQRIENLENKLEEIKAQKGKEPKEKKKQAERVKSEEELRLEREIKNAKFENLVASFEGKKDSKFSMKEVRDIWNYAKEEYLDKGNTFEEMLSGVSKDLGLTMTQVRDAITMPKQARIISDEMYKKINQRRTAISRAENYVENAGNTKFQRLFKSIPNFFFGLKTFGHGTVGAITHAGMNLFQPSQWKNYFPFFIKQFKYAFGSTAKYEQAMEDLRNHPDFTFWQRAGLAVDPKTKYDDYQGDFAARAAKTKIGKFFIRAGVAGDRGFNALKVYRLQLAKEFYDKLPANQKADPNTAVEIAKLVNHATGTSELDLGRGAVAKGVNTAFFAPKLEASRWQGLVVDPAKAAHTLSNWKEASPSEKAAAKRVARNVGEKLVTYAGLLAVNAGVLWATDSDDKINITDPSKNDFLKFKVLGKTIDPTGGMEATLRFVYSMVHPMYLAYAGNKKDLRKKPGEQESNAFLTQARYKLSPFASTVTDVLTGTDAMGRPVPFSHVKPKHGEKRYGFLEYIAHQQTPIPFSEGLKETISSMKERGMNNAQIEDILKGIAIGTLTGGTGVKIQDMPKHKKH